VKNWIAAHQKQTVKKQGRFETVHKMEPRPTATFAELHLIGLEQVGRRWGWLVGLGALLVLLGMIAIGASAFVTLVTMVFFGGLLLLAGLLETMHAIAMRGWSGFYIDLIAGLLYTVIGLMVVFHPDATAVALTLIIAVLLVLSGIFRVVIALAVSYQNRLWLFLHGVINLLLGFVIWQSWPVSGEWVVGLFVGIDLIFNGWSLIMLGLIAKKLAG
jgi:uncharacterized membrane protein HdeD (DUF308 family)